MTQSPSLQATFTSGEQWKELIKGGGIVQPGIEARHRVSLQGPQALAATYPQGTGNFTSENLYLPATSSERYMVRAVPKELVNSLELWTDLVDMW